MVTKRKNNIIPVSKALVGQDIDIDTIANNSNEDLNKNIISIQETKADLYKWSTFGNYITEPNVNQNQTWIASTSSAVHRYNYSLPFLPDNGYYELIGHVQIDFDKHNTVALYLYNDQIGVTLIGGKQPNNCIGMELEQTLNTIVHNKTLTLRTGTSTVQSGATPTFRMYIRSYRKLYD